MLKMFNTIQPFFLWGCKILIFFLENIKTKKWMIVLFLFFLCEPNHFTRAFQNQKSLMYFVVFLIQTFSDNLFSTYNFEHVFGRNLGPHKKIPFLNIFSQKPPQTPVFVFLKGLAILWGLVLFQVRK